MTPTLFKVLQWPDILLEGVLIHNDKQKNMVVKARYSLLGDHPGGYLFSIALDTMTGYFSPNGELAVAVDADNRDVNTQFFEALTAALLRSESMIFTDLNDELIQ